MGILDGKVAIVTGAGAGIGRQHAIQLAKEGAKVVVNDLGGTRDGTGGSDAAARKVADEIKAMGGEAVPNFDSVVSIEGGERILKTALDAFGKVDILVNNAGILRDKSFVNMTEEMWDAVIAVHLKGAFCVTKPVFANMKDRGGPGRIINTSSTSGMYGQFGQANYSSAKAGIAGFTWTLAIEGAKYGITANAILPIALTRLTEDLPRYKAPDTEVEVNAALVPPVAVWLASDEAAGVTGNLFFVKGNDVRVVYVDQKPVANRPSKDGPWNPREIGAKVNELFSNFKLPGRG